MLTTAQLKNLERSLRADRVLSVYIDGTSGDVDAQRTWRLELDHRLADIRKSLEEVPHNEREQFETCVDLLDSALTELGASIRAPGWAAFVTPDGVREAHALPSPVPTLAAWQRGARIAPYMRAFKEGRPVIVVLADAHKAMIYRYHMATLEHVDAIRAHHVQEAPLHMGASNQGFHPGTRGTTGREASQRARLEGRDRMIAEAIAHIGALAGGDGWIVLGGIHTVDARLAEHLASVPPSRMLVLESLDIHSSDAQIIHAARLAASRLRDALDERRIAELANDAAAKGLGTIGVVDTRNALEQLAVRELYFTSTFLTEHAEECEVATRAALDQDATIELVSGEAAAHLERNGGITAALRFRPATLSTTQPVPAFA